MTRELTQVRALSQGSRRGAAPKWHASGLGNVLRRGWRSAAPVWALWGINIAALCVLTTWILCDGRFADVVHALKVDLYARYENGIFAGARLLQFASHVLALKILAGAAIASLAGIFLALFFGAPTHRRVRSWMAFTLLLAVWLTLLVTWQSLAWHGQIWRMMGQLSGFEAAAAMLRNDWPMRDGERDALGPYMAYPVGDPRMLLLLTTPNVPGSGASFSAVERAESGALRFQLVGAEPGVWLEWHPAGSNPQSFVGGLANSYPLERFAPLSEGWYLVRYKVPRLLE